MNNLLLYRHHIMAMKSNMYNPPSEIPEGYQQLDWIGSNGVAYIDTGVNPIPNKTKLYIDLLLNEANVTKALLGSRSSVNSGDAYNCSIFIVSNLRLDWTGSTKSISVSANTRYEIECENNTVTVNGTTYSGTITKSSSALSGSILLFNINTGTTPDNRIINAKIYNCKIWDENGQLIRNFIPVKNPQGVYGLFDKVNSIFYSSANSSSLIGE